MSKRDVIDKEQARRFAWRIAAPEVDPPADKPPEPAPAPRDPDAAREHARHAAERCRELANEVQRVWEMTSPPQQAAATQRLVRLASRMGFDVFGMEEHALAAVRLWRLVVRHHASAGRRFDLLGLSFLPVSSRPSEVVDLLVEAAQTGDQNIAFALDMRVATEETGRRHPELGERLAHVVDSAKEWKARALAARWLSLAEFPAAIPALRRALRQRHARLRHAALFILPQMRGSALREEDVLWLLEDAVKHPLPLGYGGNGLDKIFDYEAALLEAVKKAPPAEGWRPLEIIASGGGEHVDRDREGLGAGWALRALAAGYPERAAPRIDRELLAGGFERRDAVDAIGLLPDELARPRLLAAAAMSEHDLAERARTLWFERFGAACPVEPLAGVAVELLSRPPSERFLSCLTVLRGASEDARKVMMAALVAEVPERETPPESLSAEEREALVLLLHAVRHGIRTYGQPSLPSREDEWVDLLLKRFGEPAFTALAGFAAEGASAGVRFGWLMGLLPAARGGRLTEPQRGRLREIACAALPSLDRRFARASLGALEAVGAPPEVLEPLWAIAAASDEEIDRDGIFGPDRDVVRVACGALATMRGAPGLDERIAAAAEEARAEGRWARFERLATLGADRGAAVVLDVAERAVAGFRGEREARKPMRTMARALREAGRIGPEWILDGLRRPESPRFTLAASLVHRPASEPVIEALRAAAGGRTGDGASEAEAVKELISLEAMSLDDPCIEGILSRAAPLPRAELIGELLYQRAPLELVQSHATELLLGADREAADEVSESLYLRDPEGTYELFEELLPKMPPGNARDLMRHYLRAPNEAARYWVDRWEDEDSDDDDDGELDDDEDELD